MHPNEFIAEIRQNFAEVEAAGFIANDELNYPFMGNHLDADNMEGLVMRLYFIAIDPEKEIKFFINQYAENRFLYLIKVSDGVWLFVMCRDQNFAKLHFFIRYLLTDVTLNFEPQPALAGPVAAEAPTASMESAKRIQQLLLPDMNSVLSIFSKKYFWAQPKDAVGGDFYWAKRTKSHQWLVIGDCTGHSLEGALASVSIMSILNQVFDPAMNPHHLIKAVHRGLTDMQHQDLAEGYGIGSEMMVLRYDLKTKELKYSGTGISLYLINDQVKIFKTKKSAFDPDRVIRYLRSRSLQLTERDSIFVHSDGLTDQLNSRGKRLKYRTIVDQIAQNGYLVNKQVIQQFFDNWRGAEPQTDDVVCLYLKP